MKHISALWKATLYSLDGLKVLITERAFRVELLALIIALPVLVFLPADGLLKLILLLLLLLMLLIEAINSAIETVVDRISLERHPQSKIAKDLGTAAVMISIVMNLVAWAYAVSVLW